MRGREIIETPTRRGIPGGGKIPRVNARPRIQNAGERIIIRLNKEGEDEAERNILTGAAAIACKRPVSFKLWENKQSEENSQARVVIRLNGEEEETPKSKTIIRLDEEEENNKAKILIRLEENERRAVHVVRPSQAEVTPGEEEEVEETVEEETKIDFVRPSHLEEQELDNDWDPNSIYDSTGDVITSGSGIQINPPKKKFLTNAKGN